jgi:radical SAM protein with 4Fe4S-binding SPASM domain
MGDKVDTSGSVQLFKVFVDNPLTRRLLNNLITYCSKDEGSRLEIALELITGVRSEACVRCRLAEKMLVPILKTSSSGLGASYEQVKERFKESYWRKGLVNVLKGIAWFGVRRPFVPGAPFQVVWDITKACNLKCMHCYENAGKPGENELTTDEVLRGIDKLVDVGVLILAFSGGEPTIRPDILELVRHTSDRGMYTALATNGILLSSLERVKEFKRAGLEFVQISLDGVNPKTHDYFRGLKGAFKRTVQGIKNCVAEELFVEIAMTATRYNHKEISAMIDFTKELDAKWLLLYNFVPTGKGVEIAEADLTPEEREEVLKLCWNKMKAKSIDVMSTAPQFARVAQQTEEALKTEKTEYSSVVPTHFYNAQLSGDLNRLATFIGGCGAGRFYASIEPNGDIYPCVFFPHEESVRVGNILKDDFERIWRESELFLKLRDKDSLDENCGICTYRYICGGCRARAYSYFKSICAPDPGCIRNKKKWIQLNKEPKEIKNRS